MSNIHVVGIDLGTANSMVAAVNPLGHTVVLRDAEGQLSTPSVVLFDDERTIVGEEARLRGKHRPQWLAACAKRDMGQELYSQPIGRMRLPPEVIQACILNKLRTTVAGQVAPGAGVVIGVPANFNDVQRRATVEAGEMAGLRVLDVLNEPIAAALAFAEQTPPHQPPFQPPGGPPAHLLVYDLGGYTFEATLLKVDAGAYTMLGTERSEHLGGHDWDMRLVDFFAEQFVHQHRHDPRAAPDSLDRLIQLAVKAKITLGARPSVVAHWEHDAHALEIAVTRERFEQLTEDLLAQTIGRCEKLLTAAGLSWSRLSRVLLVGGATRMPAIRKALKHLTSHEPDASVCPEEAVARGAALYAAHLSDAVARDAARPSLKIHNVSTHSLGVEGIDAATGRRVNRILIPRGTPLPAQVRKEFVVKTSQRKSLAITVLEGESPDPDRCVMIGRAVLRDLPIESNQEWPVQVTYLYDANGRLSLDAHVRYTDKSVHLEVTRIGGLSAVHRERWRAVVTSAPGVGAYRQVLLDDYREETSAPIALADSKASETASADAADAEFAHEHPVLAFLQRIVPFAFRRLPANEAASEAASDSAAASASSPAPTATSDEPPTLELLD